MLGQFPDEADNTFFSQVALDKGFDTTIEEDASVRPILGLDVARFGSDENVLYVNRGGRVRVEDKWSKLDLIETARRVHAHAQRVLADIVNVDVNGVGGGVVDALLRLDEFSDSVYSVGAINSSNRSPDQARWTNARAYHYDTFRELVADGKLDLDYEDSQLREEMMSQSYHFSTRGSITMTSKDEMRKQGMSSPDSLDAAILSIIDHKEQGPKPGEIIAVEDVMPEHSFYADNWW